MQEVITSTKLNQVNTTIENYIIVTVSCTDKVIKRRTDNSVIRWACRNIIINRFAQSSTSKPGDTLLSISE